jgi:hypothetical protein
MNYVDIDMSAKAKPSSHDSGWILHRNVCFLSQQYVNVKL